MIEAAARYQSIGLRVLPVRLDLKPNGEKSVTPCPDWQHKATTDLVEFQALTQQRHNALGILTGKYDDRYLVVIDGDRPHGDQTADGAEFLKAWQAKHGAFPVTAEAKSARGGVHYFFWTDRPFGEATALYGGVDVRGGREDGEGRGYVFVAPSALPDGRAYEWTVSPVSFGIANANEAVYKFLDEGNWKGKAKAKPQQSKKGTKFTLPQHMDEGERNDNLFKYAASLQAKGLTDEEIREKVKAANEARTSDPLPAEELDSTIDSALGYPKGNVYDVTGVDLVIFCRLQELKPEKNYSTDDIGNSRLFADVTKHLCRYCADRGRWFYFDGQRWQGDSKANTYTMAVCKRVANALWAYTGRIDFDNDDARKAQEKRASRWKDYRYRETILKDAANVYPLNFDAFDCNRYLLNCQNGTLNLMTGEFYEACAEDFITMMAGVEYHPEATCPRWEKFIEEVTQNDTDLAEYIRRVLGYCLTGDTRFECFFMLYGATTRNGKGTTVETFLKLLGDYGIMADPDTVAAKKSANGAGPSPDLARLAGKRFVCLSEPDKSLKLNAGLVKRLAAADRMTARNLNENPFEFTPNFKLFIDTNYTPNVNDSTLFRSDRVRVIPYNRHFSESERDETLKQTLTTPEALSGILNWCIAGLQQLDLLGKLCEPEAVKRAVQEYEEENNTIADFISVALMPISGERVALNDVYEAYTAWCAREGFDYPEGKKSFIKSLKAEHITIDRQRDPNKSTSVVTCVMNQVLTKEADALHFRSVIRAV